MKIIGCDLHARQQTIAMLDTDTGELEEKTLGHEDETVREFYSALRGPILVGIEATGSMQWFLAVDPQLFHQLQGPVHRTGGFDPHTSRSSKSRVTLAPTRLRAAKSSRQSLPSRRSTSQPSVVAYVSPRL